MSTKRPWFPLYAADFLTDTQAMTARAVGVYTRLLLYQWINGSVPRPPSQLSRVAGCSLSELDEVWPELDHKFNGDHETIRNPRMEKVREQQERFIESRRQAGRASGEARRRKSKGVNDIEHVFDLVGNETRTKSNQSKSKSNTKRERGARSARQAAAKRATRLPEDWEPDEKLLAWAAEKCPKVNVKEETQIFRDYFIGAGRTKVDWRRTWQVWMRKEQKKLHKVKRRLTYQQAERICIREGKTKRSGESDDEFIDRMQMLADGFA